MSIRTILSQVRLAGLNSRYLLAPHMGNRTSYCIDAGYRHRKAGEYFDDTSNEDEWQREVYETAAALMRENNIKSVCDVGCGSGHKLVTLLGEFDTIGIDLPETISKVRRKFPDRIWIDEPFEHVNLDPVPMVVCSDVIEHVPDPDKLMRFLIKLSSKFVVLSTPARELIYSEREYGRFGPPSNPSHLREWSTSEFREYVGSFLTIEHHSISNLLQCTQLIVGRPKL